MATPAFRAVRLGRPHARIVLVVRDTVADVLRGAPWFDECIVCGRGVRQFAASVARIRRCRCELGLVLPNSFRSALMLRLAGLPSRVGYARDSRRWLLTLPVPRPMENGRFAPRYMVDYYLRLCEAVGLPARGRNTELPFSEQDRSAARAILTQAGVCANRPLFLLHAGAGFGPSKLWPEDAFARLAEMLQREFEAQVACIGAPQTRPTARRIIERSRADVLDLTGCGIDLHLLKCVVAASRLLVTTDSGPRHYGVALGVPTVCLMGPTDPAYSTSGRSHDHVVRVDVACGPCQRKVCPRDHRCMRSITPEMVLEACGRALRQAGRAHDD